MGIYLDNACTSSPKPSCVAKAVAAFLSGGAFNVNRGSYEDALDAEDAVLGCRELLAGLLGAPDPRNVVFTSGDTEAINLVLRGLLNPGDHVVVSSMEHNADGTTPAGRVAVVAGLVVVVAIAVANTFGRKR